MPAIKGENGNSSDPSYIVSNHTARFGEAEIIYIRCLDDNVVYAWQ